MESANYLRDQQRDFLVPFRTFLTFLTFLTLRVFVFLFPPRGTTASPGNTPPGQETTTGISTKARELSLRV